MKNKNINQMFKKTVLVSALLLELTSGAQAATINVDDGCTLNQAADTANTGAIVALCELGELNMPNVIELLPGAIINLTSTVKVSSVITINANNSTIQPDPKMQPFQLFEVMSSNDFILNNATITGGDSGGNGNGGGLFAVHSKILINNSTITNNTGGGFFLLDTDAEINNSVVSENVGIASEDYSAGGITILGGNVTISNSTISNNQSMSTGTGGGGGGIFARDFNNSDMTLSISNTTISGNISQLGGGGIKHASSNIDDSNITLNNVTIVDNHAVGDDVNGGGISSNGSTARDNIIQSLISGNTGTGAGGSEIDSTGDSIVTGANFNLFGLNGDSGLAGFFEFGSDIVPAEVNLSDIIDLSLADNGGPTPTHALAADSPALDVVGMACLLTDQTGKARPIDGDNNGTADCDIGAFENTNPDIIFIDGFEVEVLL